MSDAKIYETPSVVSLNPGSPAATVGSVGFFIAAAFIRGFHAGVLTADPQRVWQPNRPRDGCTLDRKYEGFNCAVTP